MRGNGEGCIRQRKDGRWEARLRYTDPQGRKRRAETCTRTKREAEAALRKMRRAAEDGETVTESGSTLAAWCERWLTKTLSASDRRPATQATYATLVRTHIVPALGHLPLRRITPAHVEDWVIELQGRRSASTVRQAHALLVVILDDAVTHGAIRKNAAHAVKRPRKSRTEAAFYLSEQVAALLAEADGHRLAPFLTLTAYTGLRKGEALALRWVDIELDTDTPHARITGTLARIGSELVRSEPKTNAGRRTVPLVPEAVAALREARVQQARERLAAGEAWTDTGYVFTTEIGTPVDPRNALRWFYSIRNAAGISEGSLHTLRHSAASVLLGAGVPMPVVKDVLGHSSITVTVDMYGHMAPAVVADAVARGMAGYGR